MVLCSNNNKIIKTHSVSCKCVKERKEKKEEFVFEPLTSSTESSSIIAIVLTSANKGGGGGQRSQAREDDVTDCTHFMTHYLDCKLCNSTAQLDI